MGKIYLIILGIISFITLVLYLLDKVRAINGGWRIPEKILLGFSFFGGAVGGLVGMLLFRHKTRHWYFFVVNIISIALHIWIFTIVNRM